MGRLIDRVVQTGERSFCGILARAIVVVLAAALPVALTSYAQQCDATHPCNTSNAGVVSAERETGADGCAKINAAWISLPVGGGVVDARQLTGTQVCGADPFTGVNKSGETLLGSATFQTSTTWVLGDKSIVQGIGRGDAQSTNSVIEATPSLAGPVIQLASSPIAFEGVRAEDLTVDCNGNNNATGVLDNVAQEESGLRNVLILSCTKIGLDIENGSQNSSFDDIEVLSAGGSATTQPVLVNTSGPIRGIRGITINTWSEPYPNTAMSIRTMGSYTDMHCEGADVCFYVDAQNVTLMNVECGSNVRVCVAIAPGVQNLTIMGLFSSASNGILLQNEGAGTPQVLTTASDGSGLGWYSIGNGAPATICSSSIHVTCTFKMPTASLQSAPTTQNPLIPKKISPFR